MKVTPEEFLMGRHVQYPLSNEQAINMAKLLWAINKLREAYGKPLMVSSGYRPGHFNKNAGGAKNSAHLTCEAVDIRDPNQEFQKWCLANMKLIEELDLYLEDFSRTPTWVHIQTRPTKTGNRIFKP